MCGVFGCVAAGGARRSVSDAVAVRLRDLLSHRGPDDAGLWADERAVFGHRRLSVMDPTPAGHQPMLADAEGRVWCSGVDAERDRGARYVLVYNGELYNDPQMRRGLEAKGIACRTGCDTETVLRSLVRWGVRAVGEFRGMFALAFYDREARKLWLVRDPLGVKPLYYHASRGGGASGGGGEVVFASEVGAVLGAPGVAVRPNAAMISAYLTTIRTVIGSSTMYEGVLAVRPGEVVEFDLSGDAEDGLRATAGLYWRGSEELTEPISMGVASEWVRRSVDDSVGAHLRSDVPTCALLSGGLDSTITTACAVGRVEGLRTYAAGSSEVSEEDSEGGDDLSWGRDVARALGTDHAEAVVDGAEFWRSWREMVGLMRMPMSTPNEVAIRAVASRLRADGCVVTISGEGADELFGGYGLPLMSVHDFVEGGGEGGAVLFALDSASWVPMGWKGTVLSGDVWEGLDGDVALVGAYEEEVEACRAECGVDGVSVFLRLQRRVNLTGLLQRLDTATMLAGVEGRTPFADARVARLAEGLPLGLKFDAGLGAGPAGTKRVLREAFGDVVPAGVLGRAKASFPLPFREWMGPAARGLGESGFARAVFSEEALGMVAAAPRANWRLAWPILNVAMWGDGVWG